MTLPPAGSSRREGTFLLADISGYTLFLHGVAEAHRAIVIKADGLAAGKGVVVISSEMPELLGICDRIYVLNEGRIVGEMPASEASQEKIMRAIVRGVHLLCDRIEALQGVKP